MPLIIKVAVSRKLTEDFNSRGWSLDIQSELDPRTLDDTNQLANSTNYLFQLANDLLEEQVQQASGGDHTSGNGQHPSGHSGSFARRRNVSGSNGGSRLPLNGTRSIPSNGSGPSNGHRHGGSPTANSGRQERRITQAQINAINKMAQKFDTNGDNIAGEDFGCKLSEVTIKQASDLIDRLKKGLESRENQGAGR